MRVLITGGAGFLGSALANQLLADGHTVLVLDDLSAGDPRRLASDVLFTRGDVKDVPKLWTLLQRVDCVYHLAARVRVPESIHYPSEYNGVCLCTGNVWHGEGENMYEATRKLGDKIFFVHVRDVRTGLGEKEFWFHKGDVDIPRVIQVLKEIGYDGYIRSEHLPTDRYRDHVPTLSGVSDVGTAWSTGYLRAIM